MSKTLYCQLVMLRLWRRDHLKQRSNWSVSGSAR
uniref:Uncharacterized protein n=1 Tax=Rhizophora mucronata TaxID=61149 RepID=A0A2P2MET4_RHIMU